MVSGEMGKSVALVIHNLSEIERCLSLEVFFEFLDASAVHEAAQVTVLQRPRAFSRPRLEEIGLAVL